MNMRPHLARILATCLAFAATAALAEPTKDQPQAPAKPAAKAEAAKKAPILERLELYAGEVRVLPIRPVSKVAMGNAKLLSSTILPNDQLLLMAESAGDTTLHIWLKDGREMQLAVHVSENDSARVLADIRALIQPIGGITAREVGGQVFIEGAVDPKVKPQLATISKAFPRVVDLTLESDMTMKKMVHLNVRIMEFKKTALERIGVDWVTPQTNTAIAGPNFGLRIGRFQSTLPGLTGPRQFLNWGTNISSILNLMETNGDAVELASPRLSTRSGGQAEFLAGGQIPIPTTNTTGQSNVTFKDYGIKLNFKPVTDADNNVLIKVDTEVSTVDNSVTVQGIPGFLTRRTSAEVNLKDGEPIALSGLIDASISNNINKLPLLGDIPVLGALFSSSEFRNNRTELVVFVEPRIVEAGNVADPQADARAALVEKKRDALLKDNLAE
jgi:pilus assembly protein CpaC